MHKGRVHKWPGRNNFARGIPKGSMFEMCLECNDGLRKRRRGEQLYVGSKKMLYEAVRQTL
jgi:hypothetical protein